VNVARRCFDRKIQKHLGKAGECDDVSVMSFNPKAQRGLYTGDARWRKKSIHHLVY
jgi:hypothetical protein